MYRQENLILLPYANIKHREIPSAEYEVQRVGLSLWRLLILTFIQLHILIAPSHSRSLPEAKTSLINAQPQVTVWLYHFFSFHILIQKLFYYMPTNSNLSLFPLGSYLWKRPISIPCRPQYSFLFSFKTLINNVIHKMLKCYTWVEVFRQRNLKV